MASPWATSKLLKRKEDENTFSAPSKLSPAHPSALLCSPSPHHPLLNLSSDTSHQDTSLKVVVLWRDGTRSRAATASHCHHSSSISSALSTQRDPAWVSLREMPGCDWHIQVSWEAAPIMVGSDRAQPATLQGASEALGTS